MGYGSVPETLFGRDKGATRSPESTFQDSAMVKKIPRDHRGLLIGAPFKHGKQTNIINDEVPAKRGEQD